MESIEGVQQLFSNGDLVDVELANMMIRWLMGDGGVDASSIFEQPTSSEQQTAFVKKTGLG